MSRKRPTVLLEHYLKQLKLPTMLREYQAVAAACAKAGEDHVLFLMRLAERELLDREQRATERRIKAARFPILKTLDTFDISVEECLADNREKLMSRHKEMFFDVEG